MNKKYLEQFYYNEISELILVNSNIKNYINKIEINQLSINSINEIIKESDKMVFLYLDKAISVKGKIIDKNKEKEIKLINGKNIKIYDEYIIVDKKIFTDLLKNILKLNIYLIKMK